MWFTPISFKSGFAGFLKGAFSWALSTTGKSDSFSLMHGSFPCKMVCFQGFYFLLVFVFNFKVSLSLTSFFLSRNPGEFFHLSFFILTCLTYSTPSVITKSIDSIKCYCLGNWSFIKRHISGISSDNEWYNEWQRVTTSDTASDREWYNEWKRMKGNDDK